MGLPPRASEYLLDKVPQAQLLLTGLAIDDVRFLRALAESATSPGREDFPFYAPGDREQRPGTGLLAGRRDQFDRLLRHAREAERTTLAAAIADALDERPPPGVELRGRRFEFGTRTYVMGIVNVTPDSFSDGGKFLAADAAIRHGLALAEAGADLLDIGGESTRPGAEKVSDAQELARVLPVIEGLLARCPLPISIDTTKAAVARRALEVGASLVNDISGFRFDPELPGVVAQARAACCLMHIQGTPETMQADPRYGDVVEESIGFLREGIERAVAAGVPRDKIWVDPGVGFGKTLGHNLALLRRLDDYRVLRAPVLVGTSRKSFLGHLTGRKAPQDRVLASAASAAVMATLAGADVVRVHDVAETKEALAVAEAVRSAREGGDLFVPRGTR